MASFVKLITIGHVSAPDWRMIEQETETHVLGRASMFIYLLLLLALPVAGIIGTMIALAGPQRKSSGCLVRA
jgi:hypothetical protein